MFCLKIIQINVAGLRIMRIFAVRFERNEVLTREHSSVGLEHLPYKQRVGGSTPSAPTKEKRFTTVSLFFVLMPNILLLVFILKKG